MGSTLSTGRATYFIAKPSFRPTYSTCVLVTVLLMFYLFPTYICLLKSLKCYNKFASRNEIVQQNDAGTTPERRNDGGQERSSNLPFRGGYLKTKNNGWPNFGRSPSALNRTCKYHKHRFKNTGLLEVLRTQSTSYTLNP